MFFKASETQTNDQTEEAVFRQELVSFAVISVLTTESNNNNYNMRSCCRKLFIPWRSKPNETSHGAMMKKQTSSTRSVLSEAASPSLPAQACTSKERVMADFINMLNAHDNLDSIFTKRADILFEDASMTVKGYQEELDKLFRSFPDFSITVNGRIHEIADGTVVASLCREQGTFTGEPYGFGPYPDIPAVSGGKHVQNDLSRITATFQDGLISRLRIVSMVKGGMAGPSGFYEQVGGLIF